MDDQISRKAAIDVARKCIVQEVTPACMLIDKAEIMTELMMLPSIQPEQRSFSCGQDNDLINRKAAIDALGKEGLITAMVIIDRLPSTQTVARDINVLSNDLIIRQEAIDQLHQSYNLLDAERRLEDLPSAQPEPCDDAVSKEAVSSWLKQYGQDILHGKYKFSLMYIWKKLMDLPSVTPKQPTIEPERTKGHWTHRGAGCFECDQCGELVTLNVYIAAKASDRFKFCPSCGADMRGEQE